MKLSPLTLLVSLTPLVQADTGDGVLGLGGPPAITDTAPITSLPEEQFAAFFQPDRRNATGRVQFEGYDVSEAFPPNTTATGWGATIDVAMIDVKGGDSFPGTRITFQAPSGMELPGNNSGWNTCISVLPPQRGQLGPWKEDREGKGSCSFLPEDCQAALQTAANDFAWRDGGCFDMSLLPQECKGDEQENSAFGFGSQSISDIFNGSTAISRGPYSSSLDADGSSIDPNAAYDTAVGGYWLISVNWGKREEAPGVLYAGDMPKASVLCMKANELENGSEAASEEFEGGSGGGGGNSTDTGSGADDGKDDKDDKGNSGSRVQPFISGGQALLVGVLAACWLL